MKRLLPVFLLFLTTLSFAQTRTDLETFLGYPIGDHFTYHHLVVDYFQMVADQSDQVEFVQYGETWERRPLVANIISSAENIKNLETIRRNNLIRAGKLEGTISGKEAAIVFLVYNIHGDEASGTEAALWTLERLTSNDPSIKAWLDDVVVVIDPCENPDGRDRYANWFNQVGNSPSNPHIETAEHRPPWPGGRVNHYMFDLNRDWAWQTQQESKARASFYHSWMPQVHVDLHEMGHNDPYFFAPAAKPFHEVITPWQKEFQDHVGSNNAKYFDEEGWLYYSGEIFDLLYPSYGDTWPTFQGAIGMTYERGGSRNAGTHVITERGDTLSLRYRAEQHMMTSLSTVESASNHQEQLLKSFKDYFDQSINQPSGDHKSYVFKASNGQSKLEALGELLKGQGIEYGFASESGGSHNGFDYKSGRQGPFKVEANDLVISAYQPHSTLLRVLMEPKTKLEDSLTYDLTAWAIPYAFDLEAFATKDRISVKTVDQIDFKASSPDQGKVYAVLANWQDANDVKFLAQLFKSGIKVRHAQKSFLHDGESFERGTLIITRSDNRHLGNQYADLVSEIAAELKIKLHYTGSGYTSQGIDLGSDYIPFLQAPKVAMIRGDGVSVNAFGELWYYFEQVIEYPVHVLESSSAGRTDLSQYDVLVLASGSYRTNNLGESIKDFARDGGKVIALERAMNLFSSSETDLAEAIKENNKGKKSEKPSPEQLLKRYENSERSGINYFSAGSIYRVSLDNSHPLAYGQDDDMFIMKRSSSVYPYLENGWNVGAIKPNSLVSGFVGQDLKRDLNHSLAFGTERFGGGHVVYFPDSPVFRGFWHSGKLILGNAIFLVGQ